MPADHKARSIKAPKGTRDLYPEDALRRRYIEQAWRDASIRHGFEQIEGPTFETLDLYTVKSGEAIVGELFQAFSGKASEEVEQVRETGQAPFAMRPEFTPTLARMYAARAAQLPKPTKWFTAGPYFRAERPQRGRLREFLQWNIDLIGTGPEGMWQGQADAEVVACCVDLLTSVGLGSGDMRVKLAHRAQFDAAVERFSISENLREPLMQLLDRRAKITPDAFRQQAQELGLPTDAVAHFDPENRQVVKLDSTLETIAQRGGEAEHVMRKFRTPGDLFFELDQQGLRDWCEHDNMIIRGLAYYTGTVFEVIAEGERAVAGGGRYDRLIELMGGPPTPAVGFAMGDVVLSLLLDDKGLMPEGAELMEAVSRTPASVRPEAFVIPGNVEIDDAGVVRAVASLRRAPTTCSDGSPCEELKPWRRPRGLHARRSYKSTRNVGKLLKDAATQRARLAVILESADSATIKNLDTGEQDDRPTPLDTLQGELMKRLAP